MICKLKENRVSRTYLGGSAIDRFFGKAECVDGYTPEDWTASTVFAYNATDACPEGLGVTEDGTPITELLHGKRANILVKLLNSAERLVIQAHPTVDFAREVLGSDFGKTECWYFLDCAPDAAVYIGFKEGGCRKEWEQAFYENDSEKMLSMLHRLPVKKGDFVFVGGGVPHAIDAGCFMIELQEPSDLMVVNERFTPSGREIPEQRLHMGMGYGKMFDVYDYTGYSLDQLKKQYCPEKEKCKEGLYRILGPSMTDMFSMYQMKSSALLDMGSDFCVAIVAGGEGYINGISVKRGDRLVIVDEQSIAARGDSNFDVIVCVQ